MRRLSGDSMFFLYCEIAGESFNRDILESLEPRCISLMSGMTAISLAWPSVVPDRFKMSLEPFDSITI